MDDTAMPFAHSWDDPPYYTNDTGTSFWLDKTLTKYAHNKGLSDVIVFWARNAEGHKGRLLTCDGEPVLDDMNAEAIACRIDAMAFEIKKT